MRVLAPLSMALVVLALPSSEAAAGDAEARENLTRLRTRTIEVRADYLVPVLDSLVPPLRREVSDIRSGVGVEIANQTPRPMWALVRLLSAPAGDSAERFVPVSTVGVTSIVCALDTVLADQDYPMDIVVFADRERRDTLEVIRTRLRFERVTVHSHVGRLARARLLLPATKLPQSYGDMLQVAGAPGGKGRLTVGPDHFEFVTDQGELVVEAADVGAAYLSGNLIKVHYRRGGLWRQLAFGHRPRNDMAQVLKFLGQEDALAPVESEQRDRVLASLQAMVAERGPAAAPGPEPKESWFQRLVKQSYSEPPPPVAAQEEARLTYGSPIRKGPVAELGIGVSRSEFPGDTLGVITGWGFALVSNVGVYLNPRLALGVRASLLFTEALAYEIPVPIAVSLFTGPSVQFWVADHLFLGVNAGGSIVSSVDGPNTDGFGWGGRVGYMIPGARNLHVGATLEWVSGVYPAATANSVLLVLSVQGGGRR